jgi:hypothetical protein
MLGWVPSVAEVRDGMGLGWRNMIPEHIVVAWARFRDWTPIGATVTISVDDSGDTALIERRVRGIVRAFTLDARKRRTLLVELSDPIDYVGHYSRAGIQWIVATSCIHVTLTRAIFAPSVIVRIVDAPSFRDSTYGRTIGVGRLRVHHVMTPAGRRRHPLRA